MRRSLIWATALCMGLATPAFANPHVDRVVSMLQSEGYQNIEVERTWLGRIRVEAEKGEFEREIVLNRSTGEILRDYILRLELFPFDDEDEEDDEGEDPEEDDDDGEEEFDDDEEEDESDDSDDESDDD